jgi:hypothetical protein
MMDNLVEDRSSSRNPIGECDLTIASGTAYSIKIQNRFFSWKMLEVQIEHVDTFWEAPITQKNQRTVRGTEPDGPRPSVRRGCSLVRRGRSAA